MSISFGDSQRRYGNLAQADNYHKLACLPTSITNALLALNLDALMQDPSRPASWESLYATRNKLAEDYFYTSKYWQNFPTRGNPGIAKSLNPALPDPTFIDNDPPKQTGGFVVAPGTVPSMALKGMLSYFEDQGLNDAITLTATGLIKGKAGANTFNFAGFDVQTTINNQTVTTPSQNDLSNTFAAAKNGDSQNNLDFLMANLERGPVVFGMYYTNEPGGHAVLATHLDLNDTNANGILEKNEESKIWFIDPLNPGSSYDPSVESSSNKEAFNQIKTLGAAKPTSATIWQDENGFLMIEYYQKSLVLENRTIQLLGGDSSNGTTKNTPAPKPIDAAITMAAGLSTSGLASDFDRQAGRLATTTPGLIDFSFLRADSDTNTKTLSGQAYANESSALTNNYFYFECLNTEGSIAAVDPITGLTTTLNPGDTNYDNAAWELAQQFSASGGALSLGERQSQDKAVLTAFTVDIAKLSTGYLAPITKTSTGDIWVPFSAGNSDNEQHYLSTGHLSWRMEDLTGLGDQDFNDLHVSILINSIS